MVIIFVKLVKTEQDDIRIVIITSRDELDDIKIGLEMGADAYMSKPIQKNELLKTIAMIDGA
jgi:DNA-binding response OmpR family regulator